MAFINVAEWTPTHVADWLKGLDDSILPYVAFFLNNNVNGCRLLLLSSDDLESLNVNKIGHQELILEGVDLLRHLHYNSSSDTLQSQALRLGCKARSLYNQLKHDEHEPCEIGPNGKQQQERVSTNTLSGVSDILVSVKSLISWIDRYPFCSLDEYTPVRKTVLRHSIELASTAQRDQFVDQPNQVIKASCISLADLCDRIVQQLSDSLAIQPAALEVVPIMKRHDEDLGLHIFSSYSGIHVVGGINALSPAHKNGHIEEGDEIIQINYQTVVGWQLKNLVNSMKEHPTQIRITTKRRPSHSPRMGQISVAEPIKIPTRKTHTRSQANRGLRNAAMAGEPDSDDDANEKPFKAQPKGPVYQLNPRRPKKVQRRNTFNGQTSPTAPKAPVRLEDLYLNSSRVKKDPIGRSASHDLSKNIPKLSPCLPQVPSVDTPSPAVPPSPQLRPVPSNIMNSAPISGGNSSQVPYAKVQPLPATERSCPSRSDTIPKQVMYSPKDIYDCVAGEQNENYGSPLHADRSTKAATRPGQNVGVVIPSHSHLQLDQHQKPEPPARAPGGSLVGRNQGVSNGESLNSKLGSLRRGCERPGNPDVPPPLPLRTGLSARNSTKQKASRRISCSELGQADFQGWLFQRREHQGFLVPSSRWSKRWVVLKQNLLYCYRTAEDAKADCMINLPGFVVAPATECKSKKNAFKIYNLTTAFHFASDAATEMSKWISKIGFAAISFSSTARSVDEAFFSETDESENETSALPRSRRAYISRNPCRDHSPGSTSTSSSSSDVRSCQGAHRRSNSTSSSTSMSSASNRDNATVRSVKGPRVPAKPAFLRSSSSLDPASITASLKLVQQTPDAIYDTVSSPGQQFNYTQIAFQPPSPGRSRKPLPSPKTTPCASSFSVARNSNPQLSPAEVNNQVKEPATPIMSTPPPPSSTPASCNSSPSKRSPPTPQPRSSVSKLRDRALPELPIPKPPVEKVLSCTIVGDIKKISPDNTPATTPQIVDGPQLSPLSHLATFSLSEVVYNTHVVPQEQGARLGMAVDPEIFSVEESSPSPETGYMSILDKEYNRLFGKKGATDETKCISPRTTTSDEISSLYGMKPKVEATRSSESDVTGDSSPHRSVSATKLHRSQSPNSDNSLSSSSGISSYYSAFVDMPNDQRSPVTRLPPRPKLPSESGPEPPERPTGNKPVKSNSFRLFNSPKLLKKFSTPKYHKERRLEKTVKTPDDVKKPGNFFLNSPKLARAIFGFKKEANALSGEPCEEGPGPYETSAAGRAFSGASRLNRSSSDSSFSSDSPFAATRKAKPALTVATNLPQTHLHLGASLDNCSADLPLTPETPRKPTMGVNMLKKRASNVSSDTGSITTALQQYNAMTPSPSSSAASIAKRSATGSPDTEEEWATIVKTLEQVGLSIEQTKSDEKSSPIDDEHLCHLVLSLRARQRALKGDKQSEFDAIEELLKEPISLDKLQKWLKKYPNMLP